MLLFYIKILRDQREIDVGISEAIAMSDEVVSNNNLTMAELQNKVLGIVRKWLDNIDSINNGSFRNYKQ